MALKRISDFSDAGALDGTELVELDVAGVPKKTTTQDIADLGTGGGGSAGPGGGDFSLIEKVVTTGSATTISFSSIPSSFTDLMLTISGRDTNSGSSSIAVRMQINGDSTSGNYTSSFYIEGFGSGATFGVQAPNSDGSIIGYIPGTNGSVKAMGAIKVLIPNYAGTVFEKMIQTEAIEIFGGGTVGTDAASDVRGFRYDVTAAIGSLIIKSGGTAFVNGTTATLYGIG